MLPVGRARRQLPCKLARYPNKWSSDSKPVATVCVYQVLASFGLIVPDLALLADFAAALPRGRVS